MTDEELDALVNELEAGFLEEVTAALSLTAKDFADAVDRSTELVAAAFSVSRIGTMWKRRVSGLVTKLRGIARRASRVTAENLGETPPLAADLDAALDPYMEATTGLLNAVGDRMAADATRSLAEGVAAGEDLDQLKNRMLALFAADGNEMGPNRANRIAATETTRAFNAGTFESARLLTGDERPLVKQWVTRRDTKVRDAHADTDGQIQFLDDPFDVTGTPMQYPGDPTAPADLTINCRCIMRATSAPTERTASMAEDDDFQSRMPVQLKEYWLTGPGAARIGWGTPGSFERCVTELRDDFPQDPEGLCANLYHEATGEWPGQRNSDNGHTGGMIALVPSTADAERMAVAGGEPVDELHLTLAFLGESDDWSENQRGSLMEAVRRAAGWLAPITANAFGVARWNASSDEPVWVWNVGDGPVEDRLFGLTDAHREIQFALEDCDRPPMPVQHSPWSPHMTATYGDADHDALNEATGPVTFDRLRVAFGGKIVDFELTEPDAEGPDVALNPDAVSMPPVVEWKTPEPYALAFENQQTGDGRVFSPGALTWDGPGPWPLQYADEMNGGHDGAQLAGAINYMGREGDRLDGAGVLYLTQPAGAEAAMLLAQDAPLGVSVDLDDVDIDVLESDLGATASMHLLTASVMPWPDGGYRLTGETAPMLITADGGSMRFESRKVSYLIGEDGRTCVDSSLFAAAGDPDPSGASVVDRMNAGDYLMRITRGRVRGATLVTIPAYANARIVLSNPTVYASASPTDEEITAAVQSTTDYDRVLRHVRRSKAPVGAARLAQFLRMPVVAAQRLLAEAAKRGEVVRLTRGLYTDATTSARADHVMMDDLAASVTGAVDLPVASREDEWDGDGATRRVFEWADGDAGKIARAYAYRDDDADPLTQHAYKLGYADVVDGVLTIIPRGVSAALGALNGARGGVDIPAGEVDDVRARLEAVAAHVDEELDGGQMQNLEASAWSAMQELPPMPAAWFAEPTEAELPPGGPGVNYANGRIFGWVAQAGEPHAGFAKKITIDTLGRIDTTHFLRQRFTLDDGSLVKAGAYTMNAGHHRDGAECETSACQFDDTRTVAGIVTVGMNARGMWFSGAAAPWLSEWDRRIFAATQPSYHMKKSSSGGWQLRAVLGVPVPGHSSPLLASAVFERSQMALTASATMAEVEEAVAAAKVAETVAESGVADTPDIDPFALDYDRLAAAIVNVMDERDRRKAAEEAELAELLAMAATLDVDTTGTEGA